MKTIQDMKRAGYVVVTDVEASLLNALLQCVDVIRWVGTPPHFTREEFCGQELRDAEEAIALAMKPR